MEKLSLKSYTEEDGVEYDSDNDLSYAEVVDEKGNTHHEVILYNKETPIGLFIVWYDDEVDREYITVNYTIVYLDTLNKKENVLYDNVITL